MLVGTALLAAVAVLVWRQAFASKPAATARPDLQRIIDDLVAGPGRVAPGVTAYVSGPHGTWVGSAGVANVKTREPMRPDARLRIGSVSKMWTSAVILQLVGEGRMRLDDTVQRWLPGLLPYGSRITVRQLLSHTSGMIDSNEIVAHPYRYLAEVKSPALRAKILAISRRLGTDRAYEFSPRYWIEFAAALPLLFKPGTGYSYSSIGYDVAGLIAERVGGADLATLIRRRITQPLHLQSAAYDPHSRISGDYAHGYQVAADGKLTDTTGWTEGVGAGGSMISDAADEAHFLTALMRGQIIRPAQLRVLETPAPGSNAVEPGVAYGLGTSVQNMNANCGGMTYGHNGGMEGYESNVFVSHTGNRVAVLLLNGRTLNDSGDNTAFTAMMRLYCSA